MIEEVRKALAAADGTYGSTLPTLLRSYVDDEHLDRAIEVVRRLVLAIPTSLELLVDMARTPGASAVVVDLARDVLSYVADPDDLLPESRYGLYGFLDDAYLVHGVVLMVYESLTPALRSKVTVEPDRFESLGKLTRLGGKLLPPKVRFDLDTRKSHLHNRLLTGPTTPVPSKSLPLTMKLAPGNPLERFAERLTQRLLNPTKGDEPRFTAVTSDAGAWRKTASLPHFLERSEAIERPAEKPLDPLAVAIPEAGSVRLIVRFRVRPGQRSTFLVAMEKCIQASRAEAGCMLYALSRSLEADRTFVLEEHWKRGADLGAHTKTEHFLALAPSLDGLLEEPPRIESFREVDFDE